MKSIFTFLIILQSYNSFSQSKKEQIEILTNRVDSLNTVLKTERNSNHQKEIEYKEQISTLQKQLEDLNNSLTKTKEDLVKKEVEINTSNQELKNKLFEITVLKNQINEKEKLVINLGNQIDELKIKLDNSKSPNNSGESNTTLNSDISQDIIKLKNQISSLLSNNTAKDKIIQHLTNRYNEHLEVLKNLGDEGSEEISVQLVYSNDYFIAYKVNVDGFYGGTHPEITSEQYLFESKSGNLKKIEDLILINSGDNLLKSLNSELRKSEPELNSCLGNEDYENLEFTPDMFSQIKLQEDGITLEYSLSYIEKACNPYVFISKKNAAQFFDFNLFN